MSILEYERDYYIHTIMKGNHDYIRPAGILDLVQDIASDHAERIGVGFHDLLNKHYLWVVNYIEFEIHDIKAITKDITVKTWPHKRNRLEFPREFEFVKDGKTLVNGITSWFIVDDIDHKLTRADDVIYDGEIKEETYYPNFRRGKILKPSTECIKEFNYLVRPTDLDHNGHMNNARYLDILYNMQADDRTAKRVSISFVHEAMLNDTIKVLFYKENENTDIYVGYNGDEECFIAKLEVE